MSAQPGDGETAPAAPGASALLGVFDFSYQHYALGDLLTSQVNLAIMATEQGLRHVDSFVMVDPNRPSARYQPFVTRANYVAHLDNILPVFACNPLLRSLQLIRDVHTFNFLIASHDRDGLPMWPDMKTHLKMRQDFPIDHRRINAFHARHGHVPKLCAPRGYEGWARRFHAAELEGRPLVIVNPRQSSLTETPAVIYRDASLPAWHAFIDEVAKQRPDVLFAMVGGFQEWEHRLMLRKNVFIPRTCGLRLAHELALLKIAEMFIGSSSGFATFATFADVPYAIVNVEHNFAPYVELRVNDRHYPFARSNQILTWHPETTEELLALFNEVYARRDRAAAPDVPGSSEQGEASDNRAGGA
jgi:hypothetical protein